ncbi:RNA polymerase sigma-70 factor [Aestuariibaculum suncheonense]|uniref:RNA polymerase sigma-70 factor n=1 Tax=Aestuariibaculum suncheonense TaxID=1028745 RepID=A0A8J6UH87_9FLAO|nr:RNA polymerase sigma-70 factor [Aestuariibaculum suncheonense]MBD0835634.1 RNA polymerase sigma-70 factor [Aestuariibaculum suncheonense]
MLSQDSDIVNRLKGGDKKALTELYDSYWKPLFISSYNLLKDKELCEEIIQDVFIDVWNYRENLQIKISLKSYLYACVRYKVFSEFRKHKIQQVELFEGLNDRFQYATPETKLMHEELVTQIEAIVNTLPARCQEVYILSRNQQLSHKEIAEKLGISTKTVENHITLALRTIRSSLGYLLSLEMFYFIH